MQFRRALQRYGRTPEPETPYQRAGQVWDERIGSARVQARNWRLMAFGCFGLSAALSAALVWQSLQSRVTPYVVEIDRLGEARAISEAEAGFRPSAPQIAWHLGRFIRDVRTVSLDPVLTRASWLEAYDFTTKRGSQFLGDYARANDPFARIGERTVSVQVTSVVRASDRSFQVKWIETTYERGVEAGRSQWTAILTIVQRTPTSTDVLRKNPLGIYVDAIDWSRELTPDAPAPAAAPTEPPPTGDAGATADNAVASPPPSPANTLEPQP
jgi:type IV secretion system protein VirB5